MNEAMCGRQALLSAGRGALLEAFYSDATGQFRFSGAAPRRQR
jgi:hypothetical protein